VLLACEIAGIGFHAVTFGTVADEGGDGADVELVSWGGVVGGAGAVVVQTFLEGVEMGG